MLFQCKQASILIDNVNVNVNNKLSLHQQILINVKTRF